jgi:hypothetical protein
MDVCRPWPNPAFTLNEHEHAYLLTDTEAPNSECTLLVQPVPTEGLRVEVVDACGLAHAEVTLHLFAGKVYVYIEGSLLSSYSRAMPLLALSELVEE